MSIEILDCLKRARDICVKSVIPSQNTAFMWMAVKATDAKLYLHYNHPSNIFARPQRDWSKSREN